MKNQPAPLFTFFVKIEPKNSSCMKVKNRRDPQHLTRAKKTKFNRYFQIENLYFKKNIYLGPKQRQILKIEGMVMIMSANMLLIEFVEKLKLL